MQSRVREGNMFANAVRLQNKIFMLIYFCEGQTSWSLGRGFGHTVGSPKSCIPQRGKSYRFSYSAALNWVSSSLIFLQGSKNWTKNRRR